MIMSVEVYAAPQRLRAFSGDILVSVDGNAVRDVDDLHSLLTSEMAGAQATLRLIRSSQFLRSAGHGRQPLASIR